MGAHHHERLLHGGGLLKLMPWWKVTQVPSFGSHADCRLGGDSLIANILLYERVLLVEVLVGIFGPNTATHAWFPTIELRRPRNQKLNLHLGRCLSQISSCGLKKSGAILAAVVTSILSRKMILSGLATSTKWC